MNKIQEIIVEPNKINTGSTFKLKVKAIRYLTYEEIAENLTYEQLAQYSYGQVEGVI